jgi:hypothetical protein
MRKALNFMLLWLVLFLAFQAFACKSVQKGVKEEPEEATVTMSQTNTIETGKTRETGRAMETRKANAGSTETGKKKANSNETDKSKQGTLAELKEEVITEVEKILNPSVRKAILPSGVGLLILASLLSSKKESDVNKRKKHL